MSNSARTASICSDIRASLSNTACRSKIFLFSEVAFFAIRISIAEFIVCSIVNCWDARYDLISASRFEIKVS